MQETQEQLNAEIKKEEELNNFKAQAVVNKENESNSDEKDNLVAQIKAALQTKISTEGAKDKSIAKVGELGINPKDSVSSPLKVLKEFYDFVNIL